jgi:hypothetical protein
MKTDLGRQCRVKQHRGVAVLAADPLQLREKFRT